jgi:hypothetical protein
VRAARWLGSSCLIANGGGWSSVVRSLREHLSSPPLKLVDVLDVSQQKTGFLQLTVDLSTLGR